MRRGPVWYHAAVRLLMVFVDGVGLGEDDPAVNPLVRADTPALRRVLGGPLAGRHARRTAHAALVPLDAALGVPGLPQSATGQAALLTGENAPARVGRHVTAFPGPILRGLLQDRGLFVALQQRGIPAALANAYTPTYVARLGSARARVGAITLNAYQAGMRLRGLHDLGQGAAVYHDLSNAGLRARGHDVPILSPADAGRRLAAIARRQPFTLFEFFETDLAGHGRLGDPVEVIERVDAFLGGVFEATEPAETLVLLTSDHGNIEDIRTTGHTANPVPALLIGAAAEQLAPRLRDLTDVAPACLDVLTADADAA